MIESTTHYTADDGRAAVITVTRRDGLFGTPGFDYRIRLADGTEPEIKTIGFFDPARCLDFALRETKRVLATR
jgi:hypothetical protein